MGTSNIKNFKAVIIVLVTLSLLILGSFIIDRSILDMLYLVFLVSCVIRYSLIYSINSK